MPTALFVGAHPDDLEIGAGATIAKLAHEGWIVWMMIMTDDHDAAEAGVRREEARAAASALGVTEDRVLFLGAPDGFLNTIPAPQMVQSMREAASPIGADVVFTHSMADDHQDHRATHEITCSAMRQRPRLYFPIINHLRTSSFTPHIYVDAARHWEQKLAALRCHKTQSMRISEDNITELSRSTANPAGLKLVEAYELEMPAGSESRLELITTLNDSSFHRFWSTLLGDRPLYMITSVPISRSFKAYNWPSHHDQTGIALFRKSMDLRWRSAGGRSAIDEFRCDQRQAEETLKSGVDILLCGGSVSNTLTRNYFNHFEGIRYVIDYTMPDYTDIRILDRATGSKIKAEYESELDGGVTPKTDIGVLTIMRSPYDDERVVIGVMGIHGFGTIGCFKAICDPPVITNLLSAIHLPFEGKGVQILVKYEVRRGEATVVADGLHEIK